MTKRLLIGEVAAQAGVHPSTIRRLESNGLITVIRDHNGWRLYGQETVDQIRRLYQRESKADIDIDGIEREWAKIDARNS